MESQGNITITHQQEEEKNKDGKRKKLGGVRTIPFILATEVIDRFATIGFHVNMITYLTQQLNMPLVKASNTVTNFDGTASLTPLIGALVADSFAGRFWTTLLGSIIYELGLVSITTTAVLKALRPPPCPTLLNCKEASTFQMGILYLSLLLISIGLGGTRPCVLPFAADQLDMSKSGVESRTWNFFNWYYFSLGVARLTAVTLVVYIQDYVGWGWGLGIPTIAMAIAFVIFLCGSPFYKKISPEGSPLVRLVQVIVAAVKKRKAPLPQNPDMLYQNKNLDTGISIHGMLLHTQQFKWLDKAAIANDGDAIDSEQPNLWNLVTVHRVEELKSFVRLIPIWAAGIFVVVSNAHNNSFFVQQGRTMNRHLSHSFQIPPASLSAFSISTMIIGLIVYERILVPFARRFTGHPSGITCLQRIGVGYVFSILSTAATALVEMKRKRVAYSHNLLDNPTAVVPISVLWLVPQFILHGVAEVFMSVGQLEFLYDQSPESMRSIAIALYWVANSLGNYLSSFLVSLIHKYSGDGNRNWLPDRNLNRGKLDYYYWVVTGIQLINFVYFVICAWFYTSKPLQDAKEEEGVDMQLQAVLEDDNKRNGEEKLVTKETV